MTEYDNNDIEAPRSAANTPLDVLLSSEIEEQERNSDRSESNQHNAARANSDGDAEGIVRAAARTVRNLRAVLICLIAAAAASCGVLIYKLASKNEADSFQHSYNEVATKLTQSFKSVLLENLNIAYVLSVAISSGMYVDSSYTPLFPNVSINQFNRLTRSRSNQALITDLIWSPLLHTQSERKSWEAYALSKLANASNATPSGQFPPCYICGEGHEIVHVNATMNFQGVGTVTCAMIQVGALGGYTGPDECAYYAPLIQPVCGCQVSHHHANITVDADNNSDEASPSQGIFRINENGVAVIDNSPPPYAPVWQVAPSLNSEKVVMFNQMSEPWRRDALNNLIEQKMPVFSQTILPQEEHIFTRSEIATFGYSASMFYPVFQTLESDKLVGTLVLDFAWISFFGSVLPPNAGRVIVVLENTLGQMYTYAVEGNSVKLLGEGDLHDDRFDSMLIQTTYDDFDQILPLSSPSSSFKNSPSSSSYSSSSSSSPSSSSGNLTCSYRIRVYPSWEFREKYVTNRPTVYTLIVVMAFGVTSLVFLVYDLIVRQIQKKVLDSAKRSEAIVSSLFPALVRDRLFGNRNGSISQNQSRSALFGAGLGSRQLSFHDPVVSHKTRLKTYLSHPPSLDMLSEFEPIADLFPNTTVMFADIAGFTAWSSEREPSQVFKLLESLYSEFDEVARELGVFKVETIGDCYVAVTGLPEKMKHHAVVMVEFAFQCLIRMRELVSRLELVLGPGTADLSIRIGLHSGPVTAGVLRGERARFQLFGDTVNVASRIESTGDSHRVHISKETAQLLIESGKEHWLTRRKELVTIKGKGHLQTFWAQPSPSQHPDQASTLGRLCNTVHQARAYSDTDAVESGVWGATTLDLAVMSTKTCTVSGQDRLIEWNADLLQGLLQKIVVKRNASAKNRYSKHYFDEASYHGNITDDEVQFVDEITEVIDMPKLDERIIGDSGSIDLDPAVRSQLRDYVTIIASMYKDNAFHNFQHACHVAMSASKLLKRIIAPDDVEIKDESGNKMKSHKTVSKEIHDATFGISSDPLMQFAAVFSAVVHDVDHSGLTNQQMESEEDPLAIKYKGKCVAEQRSIQVAWETLMEDRFVELRRCIYQTEEEKQRFRQLLVNAVIATDIADKELNAWRKNRWDKVFHQEPNTNATDSETTSDRKATIVFEYIIQASDVAHTMQHWHIYQKWNRRLFDERYTAYLAGREAEDPSIGWHSGEIWFFDNYIIPLAKKLEMQRVRSIL